MDNISFTILNYTKKKKKKNTLIINEKQVSDEELFNDFMVFFY